MRRCGRACGWVRSRAVQGQYWGGGGVHGGMNGGGMAAWAAARLHRSIGRAMPEGGRWASYPSLGKACDMPAFLT